MQVISGNIRGLKLESAKNPDLRPTKGRIKKSLFDILRFKIQGKAFLDLFGGTGQIGIEAFSQGAGRIVIIEKDEKTASIIKKNVNKIKSRNNIEIYCQDAVKYLENKDLKFDIIFLDPPYQNAELLDDCIKNIMNLKYLPEVIAIESLTSKEINIDNEKFYLRKKYHYGKISLNLYEKSN